MIKLIPIDPDNLNIALKDVEKYIKEGLLYVDGNYSFADILQMIRSNLLILWVVYNETIGRACGCMLTQIYKYPRCDTLSIFMLSGDNFEDMLTKFDELKEHAKGLRCKKIELFGRAGWEKVLKPLEFEKIYTVMRLNL